MLFRYLYLRILIRFRLSLLYLIMPAVFAPLLSMLIIDGFELRLIALARKRFAAVLLRLSDKKKSIRVCRAGEGDPCLSTAR